MQPLATSNIPEEKKLVRNIPIKRVMQPLATSNIPEEKKLVKNIPIKKKGRQYLQCK